MKRWILILVMAPVMYGLFRLVCWADCLSAWHYSESNPPTSADYIRAAIVFWGSLLTPLCIGLVTAVVAFRKQYPAHWSFGEMCIVGLPISVLIVGIVCPPFGDTNLTGRIIWYILLYANIFVGGAIVLALFNVGTSIRHRKWGKLSLSILVCCAGLLYLFWLYAFIIYIDT